MKKIDKLLLGAFIGPFALTSVVVVFILLMQFLLTYFDELAGKGFGPAIYAQLFLYFGINMTPTAFPLGILLASLITFGNLGEHGELTALKSAGISLLRVLLPIFVFVVIWSVLMYFSHNYVVTKANLKAFTLLHDLRGKKPSLDIKEGVFYNKIPGYSIKINKKFPDNKTLKDLIIYDQAKDKRSLTIADSGQMYTIYQGRYLVMELFNGNNYIEEPVKDSKKKLEERIPKFHRTSFEANKLVLNIESFQLGKTDEKSLAYHRYMKTNRQLNHDIDSMGIELNKIKQTTREAFNHHFPFLNDTEPGGKSFNSSIENEAMGDGTNTPYFKDEHNKNNHETTSIANAYIDTDIEDNSDLPMKQWPADEATSATKIIKEALKKARNLKDTLARQVVESSYIQREINSHKIERNKKLALAVSCIVMFLIGAPLGAIIKRGGLGIPVIIATIFFLLNYIVDIIGTDWAKEEFIDTVSGAWASNILLLPFGLIFLRQAWKDARLLEADFYLILWEKIRERFTKKVKIT